MTTVRVKTGPTLTLTMVTLFYNQKLGRSTTTFNKNIVYNASVNELLHIHSPIYYTSSQLIHILICLSMHLPLKPSSQPHYTVP